MTQSEIEPLLGLYEYEGGNRRFFTRDGKLFTRLSGGKDLEVFAAGKDRFFYGPTTLTWFEVKRDASGKHVMAMHQGGADKALTSIRSGPIPPDSPVVSVPRETLESYVGSYKASQGIAKIAIAEDGGLTIQLGGGKPIRLLATGESEFRADGMDGKVVFHGDGGKISNLVLHQGEREIRAYRQPTG